MPSSPSPTATLDPGAQPAIEAFLKLRQASFNANRRPLPSDAKYPPEADFTRYSWDPLRTELISQFADAQRLGIVFRGTPPTPRVTAARVDLEADPYPTVVLTNCDTPAPSWQAFDRTSGQPLPTASASAPSPYLTTVTLILYQGRWGAKSIEADTSRTCTV